MSGHPHKTSERNRLKKKADYFFRREARARREVHEFAAKLLPLGPTAVIGGVLRDIFLSGTYRFQSDVDFVVQTETLRDFDRFVSNFDAKKNRFGGCSIKLDRWTVDVWPLERTWAAVAGHISVETIADLLSATFFNWDAVLYLLDDQSILAAPNYFDHIKRRVIDINLEPNPNPLGNAVRALRYARRWRAKLGPKLAEHVLSQLNEHGWDKFIEAEHKSFSKSTLALVAQERVRDALTLAERSNWSKPVDVGIAPRQQELSLIDP